MNHRRRGFTMLELLVVIGILLLLIGIVVVGMRALDPAPKATLGTLQNLHAMLGELDAKTQLRRQPPSAWYYGGAIDPSRSGDFWRDPKNEGPSNNPPSPIDCPPGLVTQDAANRLSSDAVKNTIIAMSEMMALPDTARAVGQIAPDKLLKVPVNDPATPLFDESRYPIPLDAWNNPIIFVSASGLRGVVIGATGTNELKVITSVGIIPASTPPANFPVGRRPFFASAGPDGAFGSLPGPDGTPGTGDDVPAGDDNLYSFEN